MAKSQIGDDRDPIHTRLKKDGSRGYVYHDINPALLPESTQKLIAKEEKLEEEAGKLREQIASDITLSLVARKLVPEGREANPGKFFGKWSTPFVLTGSKAKKASKNAI